MLKDKEIIWDITSGELEKQRDKQFLVKNSGSHGALVYYHAFLKDDR